MISLLLTLSLISSDPLVVFPYDEWSGQQTYCYEVYVTPVGNAKNVLWSSLDFNQYGADGCGLVLPNLHTSSNGYWVFFLHYVELNGSILLAGSPRPEYNGTPDIIVLYSGLRKEIFLDGFESGSVSNWSYAAGNKSVN